LKKSKRYLLKLAGGIVILFIILLGIGFYLVKQNKDVIRDLVIVEIKARLNGSVELESVGTSFFKTFPYLSVWLSDLTIRDSLWDQHHHDLLHAEKVYLSFHWSTLLKGKPEIESIVLENGSIYLYTDACGYSNLSLLKHDATHEGHSAIPGLILKHTRVVFENELQNFKHDIDAHFLSCQIDKKDSAHLLDIKLKSLVHGIGFNLEKGSYLSEKSLKGNFELVYIPEDKIVLKDIKLEINDHPIEMNGHFLLDADTMSYDLQFHTNKIMFNEALSLLTQSLQQNIGMITIVQPIDVEATVAGQMARKVVPHITTHFTVKEASLETPIGQLEKSSFAGTFNNQVDSLTKPGDHNSNFTFKNVSTEWNHIPLKSSQTSITNLLHPLLICDIQSTLDLTALNSLGESSTIQFLKGTGHLDIMYQGSIGSLDTMLPELNGTFQLKDAEMHYLPRDLKFKKCSGGIEFTGQELALKNFMVSTGNSDFTMNGHIHNLLSMINRNPELITIDLSISTPALNLGDFISYVRTSTKKAPKKQGSKNKIIQFVENTDRMLMDGTVSVKIQAGELRYKKFTAKQVKASVVMQPSKVILKNVSLNHAKGKASLTGSLTNQTNTSLLKLESGIDAMDIPLLFTAFDNFGQDAVTAANTKGLLTAKIVLSGEITDRAVVKENSMKGTIDFTVTQGELNQFGPVMKINETAFKKRDFSHIQFAELKNRLVIAGSAYQIHRMEIRSNIVVLFVEGIYDPKKGTDMSIQVPVSNLTKTENKDMENKGKAGVNIRLRAKTGADGKLNVSWDPLNNASKQRKSEIK
jgi:AsmA-like protein